MTIFHILTGGLALAAGTVALGSKKGGKLHIKSGKVFVVSMIPMTLIGAWLALYIPERVTVIAGLLSAYLVATSLISAKYKNGIIPRYSGFACLLVFIVSLSSIGLGLQSQLFDDGIVDDFPAVAYYVFGGIGLFAGLADMFVLRKSGVYGKNRIARHLWRMCFALLIAVASLFLGQEHIFPKALQGTFLLASPVIITIVILLYWLIKTLWPKPNTS